MSKERPILFSAPMVNAIRDGRKSQTRRVVKPQPTVTENGCPRWGTYDGRKMYMVPRRAGGGSEVTMTDLIGEYCPYGQPGDKLWVRETFRQETFPASGSPPLMHYRADDTAEHRAWSIARMWRPSIFMPRWASRITLEVLSVRVERVQEITPTDCKAEGIAPYTFARGCLADPPHDPRWKFIELWNEINAKRGYGWDSNPWVWVVEFTAVQP